MSEIIQAVRGMNDVLPAESAAWQALESAARETFATYGYRDNGWVESIELHDGNGALLSSYRYTYDDDGNRTEMAEVNATPARRAASRIRIRPARHSWIKYSFSFPSSSIRFPILAPLAFTILLSVF